jgi:hypothetical protein
MQNQNIPKKIVKATVEGRRKREKSSKNGDARLKRIYEYKGKTGRNEVRHSGMEESFVGNEGPQRSLGLEKEKEEEEKKNEEKKEVEKKKKKGLNKMSCILHAYSTYRSCYISKALMVLKIR